MSALDSEPVRRYPCDQRKLDELHEWWLTNPGGDPDWLSLARPVWIPAEAERWSRERLSDHVWREVFGLPGGRRRRRVDIRPVGE